MLSFKQNIVAGFELLMFIFVNVDESEVIAVHIIILF